MAHETIDLPPDPGAALTALREASRARAVVVFKKSPICPVSFRAEKEFRSWLASRTEGAALSVAEIDVIAEKPLARGLVAALGIAHQSPQALIFEEGEVVWHGSHAELTAELFRSRVR